jgi:hypothetical protein
MSRTDLDPTTLAKSMRRMAGDGSVEWVMEPMQASVLLDVADMLDENAKLRELLLDVWNDAMQFDGFWDYVNDDGEIYREDELPHYYDRMRELGLEVK